MKIVSFFKKFVAKIFSKKGTVVFGILSLVYLLAMGTLFSLAGVAHNNPGAFTGKDFKSLRSQVIQQGQEGVPSLIKSDDFGSLFYGVEKTYNGQTFNVYVSGQNNCSNYLGIRGVKLFENFGFVLGLTTSQFYNDAFQENHEYCLYAKAVVVKSDGTPYNIYDIPDFVSEDGASYDCSTSYDLILDKAYSNEWEVKGISPQMIEEVNQKAEPALKEFLTNIDPLLALFGVEPRRVTHGIKTSLEASESASVLLLFTAIISLFGGPITSIFAIGLANIFVQRKKKRLLAQGVIRDNASEDLLVDIPEEIEEEKQEADAPPPPIKKDLPQVGGPIARMVSKTHIRPIFGEWVIRGVGFALLVLGSVFTHIINAGLAEGALNDAFPWFKMINSLGQFCLVIALIGIIAETRRNLAITSAVFFGAAITFYLAINSAFFFIDGLVKSDFFGISFSDLISSFLPGNIFMSMGLFTFMGMFLFEEPPEWLIKRKVFRALSIIPAVIALGSVVFSALKSTGTINPTYWLNSLFFVRNFDGLLIGIIYIYVIFFFRSRLTKKYGRENVDDLMESPSVQFQKNLVLCGVLIIYTIIFYCLPPDAKKALNLPDHTFIFALIPIFLFYKPAGRKRKMISNLIYYGLYILSFVIPTIATFLMK